MQELLILSLRDALFEIHKSIGQTCWAYPGVRIECPKAPLAILVAK
jgi:hypothetical protein